MFNIIPLILILLGFIIIITIVVRKFSVLARLDIDSIRSEQEAKFKERIISSRLKRNYFKYYIKFSKAFKPLAGAINGFFQWAYKRLVEFREDYKEESNSKGGQLLSENLLQEAEELVKGEKYAEAESKFIQIISLDSKNTRAFRGLGKVYYEEKNYGEAKQTLEHVIRLLEKDYEKLTIGANFKDEEAKANKDKISSQIASTYFDLALILRAMEDMPAALAAINKALKIEPGNPRYLDIKLEISIINKDKISALAAYEKLVKVNPENQKLEEFKKQIDEL